MIGQLPLRAGALTIRQQARPDLDRLAAWPEYPFPHGTFAFSFRATDAGELDELFARRESDPARLSLVIDRSSESCVGCFALLDIDGQSRSVGNVAARVHPLWCDSGMGTEALRSVLRWAFDGGIKSVSLDVVASNARAVRCYEKVGFESIGELWRPAPDLTGVDLDSLRYDFLRGHTRDAEHGTELKFLVMRRNAESGDRSDDEVG
jgi:RimJ/RimL family protein N-acetyltransferase